MWLVIAVVAVAASCGDQHYLHENKQTEVSMARCLVC